MEILQLLHSAEPDGQWCVSQRTHCTTERTDLTAWLAMVPDPSEMSRTGSVLRILDISEGSDRGQPGAVTKTIEKWLLQIVANDLTFTLHFFIRNNSRSCNMTRTEHGIDTFPSPIPVISVIIPVYNVSQYLEKCIKSVQNNTYHNLEIICIDDGSTDESGEILDNLASEDSRIVVIHQHNNGVAAARNAGLNLASGEYVAFIDSDDFIHPRYFESMLRCMIVKAADIVACGCCKFTIVATPELQQYQHIPYKRIGAQSFLNHYYTRHMIWARLYHRKHLIDIQFATEVGIAEDTLYNLRVINRLEKPVVYETALPLYYYLTRGNSIVHTVAAERMGDAGKWYLKNREHELLYAKEWGWLLPMGISKMTLSYRHTVRYIHRDDAEAKLASRILKTAFRDMCQIKRFSIRDYIILSIVTHSPWMYRLFQIVQDPTMLTWEKRENLKDR